MKTLDEAIAEKIKETLIASRVIPYIGSTRYGPSEHAKELEALTRRISDGEISHLTKGSELADWIHNWKTSMVEKYKENAFAR